MSKFKVDIQELEIQFQDFIKGSESRLGIANVMTLAKSTQSKVMTVLIACRGENRNQVRWMVERVTDQDSVESVLLKAGINEIQIKEPGSRGFSDHKVIDSIKIGYHPMDHKEYALF